MLLVVLLLLSILLVAVPCRSEGDQRPGLLGLTHGEQHRVLSPLHAQPRDRRPQPRRTIMPFTRSIRVGTVRPGGLCLVCGLPKNQGEHDHA